MIALCTVCIYLDLIISESWTVYATWCSVCIHQLPFKGQNNTLMGWRVVYPCDSPVCVYCTYDYISCDISLDLISSEFWVLRRASLVIITWATHDLLLPRTICDLDYMRHIIHVTMLSHIKWGRGWRGWRGEKMKTVTPAHCYVFQSSTGSDFHLGQRNDIRCKFRQSYHSVRVYTGV